MLTYGREIIPLAESVSPDADVIIETQKEVGKARNSRCNKMQLTNETTAHCIACAVQPMRDRCCLQMM